MRFGYCLVLGAATLAGCRLIDQTSFGGTPHSPAPGELATAFTSGGRLPLVIIRPGSGVAYGAALRAAIDAAEARDGAARFRLETVAPAQGDIDGQAAALEAGQAATREVLDDMNLDGVAPDRVSLTATSDPHVTQPEIWLFAG